MTPPADLICPHCARSPLEHPLNGPAAPPSYYCAHNEVLAVADSTGQWQVRRMAQQEFHRLVRVAETLVLLASVAARLEAPPAEDSA